MLYYKYHNLVILSLKHRLKKSVVILLILLFPAIVAGQTDTLKNGVDSTASRVYLLQQVNRNGEVLPEVNIKEVTVMPPDITPKKSWYRKYDRLVYNLKTVYPYAKLVRYKLEMVNDTLSKIKSEKERKRYMRQFEKDVFKEYEGEISDLTITQGKLLIKLIDRETQNTSFDLIKEYRGGITAAFWQGIARIFGTNLKEEYDAFGADIVIEIIVNDIEAGRL